MKFPIKRTRGKYEGGDEVEFNSLEELMEFIKKIDNEIIIWKDGRITIYDDFME